MNAFVFALLSQSPVCFVCVFVLPFRCHVLIIIHGHRITVQSVGYVCFACFCTQAIDFEAGFDPNPDDGGQVVMEEDYDPDYEPSTEDLEEYAKLIGLDLDKFPELTWVAREGIKAPLPDGVSVVPLDNILRSQFHPTLCLIMECLTYVCLLTR